MAVALVKTSLAAVSVPFFNAQLRAGLGGRCRKRFFDLFRHLGVCRHGPWVPLGQKRAISTNKIFLKIPGNLPCDALVRIMSDELIKRAFIIALDRDFGEKVECD